MRRPGSRGFTLLEVMVSLAILSMMLVIILQSYRAGLGMWERQHRGGMSLETARALLSRVRSQVRSAHPSAIILQGKQVLLFRGEADSLLLPTLTGLSGARDNGLVHLVRYRLRTGDDGVRRLVAEELAWPRRELPEEGEEPLLAEELEGVEDLSLEYEVRMDKAAAAAGDPNAMEERDEDSWPPETGPAKGETLAAVTVSLKVRTAGDRVEEFSSRIPLARPLGEP